MPDDVFRWVIAISVLLALASFVVQTFVVLAMFRVAKAMQDKITPIMDTAAPLIASTRRLVEENGPKISELATEAAESVKSLHVQVERLSELVKDVSDRARAQVARIDGAVDITVDQVQQASETVRQAIMAPVRQVDGIMHGIRAAISVVAQGRRESVDHATQDEEMFI